MIRNDKVYTNVQNVYYTSIFDKRFVNIHNLNICKKKYITKQIACTVYNTCCSYSIYINMFGIKLFVLV